MTTGEMVNAAIIAAIKGSAVQRIVRNKVVELFGTVEGEIVADKVTELVREAVSMPIEWGDMTLQEGVHDILRRFRERHPEFSDEALHEIGRCVGWNLR